MFGRASEGAVRASEPEPEPAPPDSNICGSSARCEREGDGREKGLLAILKLQWSYIKMSEGAGAPWSCTKEAQNVSCAKITQHSPQNRRRVLLKYSSHHLFPCKHSPDSMGLHIMLPDNKSTKNMWQPALFNCHSTSHKLYMKELTQIDHDSN